MDQLSDLITTDLREQQNYFYGLAGKSLLVARSSINPFTLKADDMDSGYWKCKKFGNIGRHPILEKYDDAATPSNSVRIQIREALKGLVEFLTIDVLRIGSSNSSWENPVVVLVKVKKGSVTTPNALQAARNMRQVLDL